MLSQTARYALIILGRLVDAGAEWCPVERIAAETCVPANYLAKILNRLAKDGIVESLKGWGGGYRLRPGSLGRPIRDVLASVDGRAAADMTGCVFGFERCDDAAPCPLHARWSRLREGYQDMLGGTAIGDLGSAALPAPKRRRCPEERAARSPARPRRPAGPERS